jgi:hypothetical protein
MNRIFLIFFLIINSFWTFGQDTIFVNQPFVGLPYYSTSSTIVNSFEQLPRRIQFVIRQLFNVSMTDFVQNIKFSHGQVIDLDLLSKTDSTYFPIEYKYVVPKYQLYFDLKDTSISIKEYSFELGLDQYGQIVSFEWPREYYNKRDEFIQGQRIIEKAIKYAQAKGLKTDNFIYKFKYDDELKKMCWEVSFLQTSIGDKFDYSKEYQTIELDAISLTILKEFEMSSVGISD